MKDESSTLRLSSFFWTVDPSYGNVAVVKIVEGVSRSESVGVRKNIYANNNSPVMISCRSTTIFKDF